MIEEGNFWCHNFSLHGGVGLQSGEMYFCTTIKASIKVSLIDCLVPFRKFLLMYFLNSIHYQILGI